MNRRALRLLLPVVVLAAAAVLVAPGAPAAAAGGPFDCQPGLYQVISGQLKLLNPITGVYTNIGSAGSTYNALGYNVGDDYLYAMGTQSGVNQANLLRIASDGTVTNLGTPTGLPVASYVSGDMDDQGNLLVRASNTTLYSIDVTAATPTATLLTLVSGTVEGVDLVWIDGATYSVNGTTLYRVDLATLTATSTTVSGLASGSFGAAWSDDPDNLYVSNNGTGIVSQITGFAGASPSATDRVTATVTSNNDGAACKNAADPFVGPSAVDDAYTATVDTPLLVPAATGVLDNDTGTGLTVDSYTQPSHGSVTLDPDGSFTYTPTAGYVGPDSFTYVAVDQFGRVTTTATVSVSVVLPAPPVADDDAYTATADTTLTVAAGSGVLVGDTGTSLSVSSHTEPSHGSLTLNPDGSLGYTPDALFSGADTFTYTICDPYAQCDTATVTVTVELPPPPVADDDAYTFTAGTTTPVVAGSGVLVGDTGTSVTVTTNTQPAHGTVVVNPDGSLTYGATAGYTGTDTFTYTICDPYSQCDTATVTVTVDPPAAPVADDDAYTVTADTTLVVPIPSGVLVGDTGTSITVTTNTEPAHGSVTLNPNGSFTYTPAALFSGTDTFTYTVCDPYAQCDTATVTVTVELPPPPTADNSSHTAPGGGRPLAVGPAAGVLTGITGTGVSLTSYTQPLHGQVAVSSDGSFSYTPDPSFSGQDSFTYTVTDRYGRTSTATVVLDVPAPGAPTPATTTTTAAPAPASDDEAAAAAAGELARTGSSTLPALALGVVLVLLGLASTRTSRRRR